MAIAVGCLGQGAAKMDNVPSESQSTAFFKGIEDRPNAITRWDEVRSDALAQGVTDQINIETWRRLLEAAAKSGLKSRIAIQLHPIRQQRAYFDEMVHVLGYDSDLFTRCRVFGFMVESYPDDPRTPKYGLLLLLESWNASWPDGINLHGNSPRETIELMLNNLWLSTSFGEFTPEKCGQLLTQSNKWSFDKSDSKWRVLQ